VSDRDDWFGGSADEEAEDAALAEDWLQEEVPPAQPWYEGIDRRIIVIAVVCVGLLIAVLAAAGVFSGGSHPAPTVSPTVTTTPVTTTTQTTAPVSQPVAAPTTTLKPGDNGAQVKVLQRALASLGFSAGTIDGDYGSGTEDAVKQFQRSAGITDDGIVGPATLRALKAALRNR
jgi:Putative peptidoglycan binding domain